MFNFIKNLFRKFSTPAVPPITRLMVLKKAKELEMRGLCYSIRQAMLDCGLPYVSLPDLPSYFPLFTRVNAIPFGATHNNYWWEPDVWDTGRMDFLNWLIEQYRDDKTDLRTLE